MEVLLWFFDTVKDLVGVLKDNPAETMIAFFMVYFVLSMYWARKDRQRQTRWIESLLDGRDETHKKALDILNKANVTVLSVKEKEHAGVLKAFGENAESKDRRVGELLEQRHNQFVDVFERAIAALTANEQVLEGASDTVDSLDTVVKSLDNKITAMDTRCQARQDAQVARQETLCTELRNTDSERRRRVR
jgi:hypothetical protein